MSRLKRCKFCGKKMEKVYYEKVTLNGYETVEVYECSCYDWKNQNNMNEEIKMLDKETYDNLICILEDYKIRRKNIIKEYSNKNPNVSLIVETKPYIEDLVSNNYRKQHRCKYTLR